MSKTPKFTQHNIVSQRTEAKYSYAVYGACCFCFGVLEVSQHYILNISGELLAVPNPLLKSCAGLLAVLNQIPKNSGELLAVLNRYFLLDVPYGLN